MNGFLESRREAKSSVAAAEAWRDNALSHLEMRPIQDALGQDRAALYHGMLEDAGVLGFGNSRYSKKGQNDISLVPVPVESWGSFSYTVEGRPFNISLAKGTRAKYEVYNFSDAKVIFMPTEDDLLDSERAAVAAHEMCHLDQVNRRGDDQWGSDVSLAVRSTLDEVEAYDVSLRVMDSRYDGLLQELAEVAMVSIDPEGKTNAEVPNEALLAGIRGIRPLARSVVDSMALARIHGCLPGADAEPSQDLVVAYSTLEII